MSIWPAGTDTVQVSWGSLSLPAWVQITMNFGGLPYIRHVASGLLITAEQEIVGRTTASEMGLLTLVPVNQSGWVKPDGTAYSGWSYSSTLAYYNDNLSSNDTVLQQTLSPLTGAAEIDLDAGGSIVPPDTVTAVDNGDGTLSISGTGVVDNGDQTFTMTGTNVTTSGDGLTYIIS